MKTISITDPARMEQLFNETWVCYVGMATTDGCPYVVPMNFHYLDGYCYLHSAPHGKKIDILKSNPRVCITLSKGEELVMQDVQMACSYGMKGNSIVFDGTVVFVESLDEKREILNCFMKRFTDRSFTYSEPSLRNVLVWKIKAENLTMRMLGLTFQEVQAATAP